MSKSTAEIRQAFLDFFHSKGHQVVASSSSRTHNDPTLLFTNAGMNQFKDVFLGLDKRNYSRATTSQRCVRAGGNATTWKTSVTPRVTIPSSKRWATSASATISNTMPFSLHGNC
ncbi:alanine--tRNA ligase-related protein [Escherichia coli]